MVRKKKDASASKMEVGGGPVGEQVILQMLRNAITGAPAHPPSCSCKIQVEGEDAVQYKWSVRCTGGFFFCKWALAPALG